MTTTLKPARRAAFLSRRTLLRSLGVGIPAVALPVLRSSPLNAAGAPPARLLVLMTANGTILDNWKPVGSGASYTMGPLLQPLERYKARMNLLQGVHVSVTAKPTNTSPDPHGKPWGGMLTGRELLDLKLRPNRAPDDKAGFASGISVDQYIASKLASGTVFPSLSVGVQVPPGSLPASYTGANQPVFPENNPFELYKRVFASGVPSPTPGSAPATDDTALKKLLAERKSILDHTRGDLIALMPRLPSEERTRVERHLTSLREIEQRLVLTAAPSSQLPSTSAGVASCSRPSQGATIAHMDHNNFPKVADLQADILAAAFACDLTRVAVLTYSGSVNNQTFPFLGIGGHHNMSHGDDTKEPVRGRMGAITKFHAERFAYVLDRLDSYREGNGRTLLDNSLALWTNEISRGPDHSYRNIPFVLAGSAGGSLKTGRYIVANNKPHNDLLVTICQAMGLKDVTTFGDPQYCTGPLTDLA